MGGARCRALPSLGVSSLTGGTEEGEWPEPRRWMVRPTLVAIWHPRGSSPPPASFGKRAMAWDQNGLSQFWLPFSSEERLIIFDEVPQQAWAKDLVGKFLARADCPPMHVPSPSLSGAPPHREVNSSHRRVVGNIGPHIAAAMSEVRPRDDTVRACTDSKHLRVEGSRVTHYLLVANRFGSWVPPSVRFEHRSEVASLTHSLSEVS